MKVALILAHIMTHQGAYIYPQEAYPYGDLIHGNRARGRLDAEFELEDTHVLDGGKFWEITVEYAKGDRAEDLYFR